MLYRFIGEAKPVLRSADLLTEDHPLRSYPPLQKIRFSGWLRGLFFIGVFGLVATLFGVTVALVPSLKAQPAAVSVVQLIAAVVSYLLLVLWLERRTSPHELALGRWAGLLKGGLLGFILVSVGIGILAVLGAYEVVGFDSSYSPWGDLLVMGLGAGISEEILLRGALFRIVEETLGSWGSVVISAVVFGLLHLGNAEATLWGAVSIIIEAGLLFAAVYILTRSLWWCIGLHFAWNMTEGPLFGSVVSGSGDQQSWIEPAWSGPQLLTGGNFGFEGSIVPVVLLGGLSVALLVYAQRQGLMLAPSWKRKQLLSVPGA